MFRAAREMGAYYRSALAAELTRDSYAIEQATGKDGRYFEITGADRRVLKALPGGRPFRARYGRAPERGELRNLALENRRSKTLTTRTDLERVWRQTGHRHNFGPDETARLLMLDPAAAEHAVEDRIQARLTERQAIFDPSMLRTSRLSKQPAR